MARLGTLATVGHHHGPYVGYAEATDPKLTLGDQVRILYLRHFLSYRSWLSRNSVYNDRLL